MKTKTVRLEYRPGERYTVEGVKGSWGGIVEGCAFFRNAGYGVGEAFRPSLLLLHTVYRGKKLVVRIDRFFKEKLGKLVESRRKLIEMSMPESVSVQRLRKKKVVSDPMFGADSEEFSYEVIETDLTEWLLKVNNFTKADIKQVNKSLRSANEERKRIQEQKDEKLYRQIEVTRRQRQRRWRKKMDALIAQEGSKYLKAAFTLGRHRQTGEGQFEFQKDGRLYVLRWQDSHVEPEGEEYVSIDRELVPGWIYLVRKEHNY